MSKNEGFSSGWSTSSRRWTELDSLLSQHVQNGPPVSRLFCSQVSIPLVPAESGVYVFTLKPSPQGTAFLSVLQNIVYVGKATNLRLRFTAHLQGKTSMEPFIRNFPNKLEFWFIRCAEESLNLLERSIYDVVEPKQNRIAPPAPKPLTAKLGTPQPANPAG
jgi:hypothetical protein